MENLILVPHTLGELSEEQILENAKCVNQLRFRYYSPKHFEGVKVLNFDEFNLYQKLNTSYLNSVTEIRCENYSIQLDGNQDQLQNALLYRGEDIIGGLSLEFQPSIANQILDNIKRCIDVDGPEEFLKQVIVGKFFKEMSIENGLKISIGCMDYIRHALHLVKAKPPAYQIVDWEGEIIGEFNFGPKRTTF